MSTPNVEDYIRNGIILLPEILVRFPAPIHIKRNNQIISLGNLRTINGGLYIWDCENLIDFGHLTDVNGPIDCQYCPRLSDINSLKSAKGFVELHNSQISHMPDGFSLLPLLPRMKPFVALRPVPIFA